MNQNNSRCPDIIIKDDFLDDPHMILARVGALHFFSKHTHPNLAKDPSTSGFPGIRTDHLHNIDSALFGYFLYKVAPLYKHEFGLDHVNAKYIFSFSKVKKDTHTWEHNDGENCIAGILYLNPDPIDPVMSGTRIADKNVENKFNRLVMYDGSLIHQQNGAWGDNWDECRLTMNMFIHNKDI